MLFVTCVLMSVFGVCLTNSRSPEADILLQDTQLPSSPCHFGECVCVDKYMVWRAREDDDVMRELFILVIIRACRILMLEWDRRHNNSDVASPSNELMHVERMRLCVVVGVPSVLWVAGSPSNTKSRGPRPTSIRSGILVYPDVWPQQKWDDNWGLCPLFGEGSWVPI